MTIVDYLKQGGKCKSKAGHDFVLDCIKYEKYPIKGWLVINNEEYPYEWTENGEPHNLPYTHCLDLVPVIPVTTYKMVDKKILLECDDIRDFYDKVYD